jgi:alpha-tubulin suppressor-like RCC1 family protein
MIKSPRALLSACLTVLVSGTIAIGMFPPKPAVAQPFAYRSVSVGYHRVCAVSASNQALCWGWNHAGSLGTSQSASTVAFPSLVTPPPNDAFVHVEVGDYLMSCGLTTTANILCWGEGGGRGSIAFPVGVQPVSLSVGATQGCAVASDNNLYCWGAPSDSSVGVGPREPGPANIALRVPLPADEVVQHVSAGVGFTCATTSHDAYCWGTNAEGQLGTGYAMSSDTPMRVNLPHGVRLTTISTGLERGCGVDTNGQGWCWGRNYMGSLGDDTYANSRSPRSVVAPPGTAFRTIETGWYHTCGITTSNTAMCWGDNGDGQLATGNTYGGKTLRPVALPADTGLSQVSTGLAVTCFIDTAGGLRCAGVNYWGNLGRGHTTPSTALEPIATVGTPGFSSPLVNSVTTSSAALTTTVLSFGAATDAHLEYALDASFSTSTRLPVPAQATRRGIPPSLADRFVSLTITDLQPRTTYFARFVGTNSFGVGRSETVSFATRGDSPVIGDMTVHGITGQSINIGIEIHPHELATDVSVRTSTSPDMSNPTVVPVGQFNGATNTAVGAVIDSLDAQTTYYLVIDARNALGAASSKILTATTTGAAPTITGFTATSGRRSATISVDVSTMTTKVAVHIEYRAENGPVQHSPTAHLTADGTATFSLDNLDTATTYFFRAVVANNLGKALGSPSSFRTRGGAPLVSGLRIAGVQPTSATVWGTFDSHEATTFVKALVSTSPTFDSYREQYVGTIDDTDIATMPLRLPDLTTRITYHVRFVATNLFGSTTTDTLTFTTPRTVGIHINDADHATTSLKVLVHVESPTGAVAVALSNSSTFTEQRIFSVLSQPITWQLDQPATGTSTSSVYARFLRRDGSLWLATNDSINVAEPAPVSPTNIGNAKSITGTSSVMPAQSSVTTPPKKRIATSTKRAPSGNPKKKPSKKRAGIPQKRR